MNWEFRYFKKSEFACKCCGKLPEVAEEHYYYMVFYFLGQLRRDIGKPVIISSGYRCPKHNKAVGGKTSSYHTIPASATFRHPCAVDMYCPYLNVTDFCYRLKYAVDLNYCGYHIYVNEKRLYFVHLDFRGYWSRW